MCLVGPKLGLPRVIMNFSAPTVQVNSKVDGWSTGGNELNSYTPAIHWAL